MDLRLGHLVRCASAAIAVSAICQVATGAPVMPNFANVPTGWVTDRYEPDSFSNVGTYQGHTDVLGIGISTSGDLANRPAPYQSTFYNTQGRQHAISGGAGSDLAADLFVESSWQSEANGDVRTDMWGVVSDATNSVTDYGIIGFTNDGGPARLRVWDADTISGWVDLAVAIAFGGWNSLEIDFTGTSLDYFVNGAQVYSDTTIGGDHFSAVIMQAYNFADPALGNPTPTTVPYVAHWSNAGAVTQVPEPATLALLGLGLAGLGFSRRKQ